MRVELVTDFNSPTGYSSHARALVKALMATGVDLRIRNHKGDRADVPLDSPDMDLLRSLTGKIDQTPDVRIHFELPAFYTHEDGVYTVGFTVWETTKIPSMAVQGDMRWNWPVYMNRCNEIWTSCTESVNAFERSGVNKPIYLITGPVDTDLYTPGKPELKIPGLTASPNGDIIPREKRPKVLFCCGPYTSQRKNIENWVRWLTAEFPRDRVVGMLKTYKGCITDPNQDTDFDNWLEEQRRKCRMVAGPSIFRVTEMLSDEQMSQLFQTADVYVSLSRGEGLGLPVLQAMACGIPVVHTNWGAVTDYLDETNSFTVRAFMKPVWDAPAPYWADQWWAEPDLHQATLITGRLLGNLDKIDQIRAAARQTVVDRYSIPVVAQQLKARFEDIEHELIRGIQ